MNIINRSLTSCLAYTDSSMSLWLICNIIFEFCRFLPYSRWCANRSTKSWLYRFHILSSIIVQRHINVMTCTVCFLCVFSCWTIATIAVLNSIIRQGPVHMRVSFLFLCLNNAFGQYNQTFWLTANGDKLIEITLLCFRRFSRRIPDRLMRRTNIVTKFLYKRSGNLYWFLLWPGDQWCRKEYFAGEHCHVWTNSRYTMWRHSVSRQQGSLLTDVNRWGLQFSWL